jgi:hypothetical protein
MTLAHLKVNFVVFFFTTNRFKAVFCENGNERSRSIKGGVFLD